MTPWSQVWVTTDQVHPVATSHTHQCSVECAGNCLLEGLRESCGKIDRIL